MDALAAVFLGMTTIKRGLANILGTLIGVLTLGIIGHGLEHGCCPVLPSEHRARRYSDLRCAAAVRREEIRFF
jgi:ribose transport system permease protein